MDGMNLSSALEQQQNITQNGISMNNTIQAENNEAMRGFHTALTTLKGNDTKEDEINLGKIAGYAVASAEKIHEYKSAVKAGKVGEGFMGTKLVKRTGAAHDWLVSKTTGSPGEYVSPDEAHIEKMSKAAKAKASGLTPEQEAGIDPESMGGTPASTEGELPEAEPETEEQTTARHAQEDADDAGGAADDTGATGNAAGNAEAGGSSLAEEAGTGGTAAAKAGASTLEDVAPVAKTLAKTALQGVETAGKIAGGIASVAVLGDDIGNQIAKGKFFYGENLGDNIGNTTNEIGSAMDVIGVATGDPFLIMAGVGVGAVGSVISDISEFFHHKKEEKEKKAAPPVDVKAVAQTDIASGGYVAQTAPSTLQQVQVGAS